MHAWVRRRRVGNYEGSASLTDIGLYVPDAPFPRLIDRWGRLTRAWGLKWAPTALVNPILSSPNA